MTSGDFEQRPERRLEQRFGQSNYNLFIRWQALRRDSEYQAFCDKYKKFFDDDHILRWELLPTEDAEKEADHIKETYGLDYIYHHNTDLELGGFIDSCVFIEPFAVNYLLKEKNLDYKTIPDKIVEIFDPLWEPNFINLRVNVGEGITEAQLKEEFLEKVKEARELAGIKRIQSIPSEKEFQVFVVDYILKDEKLTYKTIPETIDDKFDPFWEPNYIHLRVNVGEGIPEAQLKGEFLEKVKEARELAGIKRIQSIPSERDFQIYDLLTYEKKSRKEIFKEIWPEDFEKAFAGRSYSERDRNYEKLLKKYRNQGIEDWDEKAWGEAYEGESDQYQGVEDWDAATGKKCVSPKQLYDRVAKGIKRVEKHMKRIKLHN